METHHKTANDRNLNGKQRTLYFRLGAEHTGRKTSRYGYTNEANDYAEALQALDATNWTSLKAATAWMQARKLWK